MDPAGHRRHLTLLFIDLCASSRLAERLEAEQFAALLTAFRGLCTEAVERHRGRVVRAQGDGVLAIFGLPSPAEDDGLRAAQAALQVQQAIDDEVRVHLPDGLRPLQTHSGLHGGTVLLADGDIERGRFDVVGDAPHTAARLSQLAPPGALLADLDSLGTHSRQLAVGEPTALKLPGRDRPVRAAVVALPSAATGPGGPAPRAGLAPLAGRDAVLAELGQRIEAARVGRSARRIDLVGPPGMGKTRLLDELSTAPASDAWRVLRGACADVGRTRALHPFLEMAEAAGQPHRSAAELSAWLHGLAAATPLLLLVDDWQWADDASRQLLAGLLAEADGPCVVLAARPDPDAVDDDASAAACVLAPLDERAAARIVDRWLPAADPYTVAAIHRQAGGVPLFVEELARSRLARRGQLSDADHPGWLGRLVASRLSLLSLDQQEVIRTAAVLGNVFPRRLLAAVGGWRDGDLDRGRIGEGDFLWSDGELLRFKHGLTREAVYDSVALHERTALHRRATRALDSAEPTPATLEARAYHARAAGLWPEAAEHAEAAADQAMAAFAMDVVRRHCLAALDAIERIGLGDPAQARRWCLRVHQLGLTCIFDPLALPDVLPTFERCLGHARALGEADLIARSAYWLGHVAFGLGASRQAIGHLREALAIARGAGDARLAAQIEATLGQTLAAAGDVAAALPLMDNALALKQRHARPGGSVAVGSAFTLASKGGLLADQGDFVGAQRQFDEAMALVGDSTHPVANSIRSWAMVVLVWQGRWDELAGVSADSARRAHATQALLPLAIARACEGYGRWTARGDEQGLRELAAAVQWLEQRRGRFMTSIYRGWLVEALAHRGDLSAARRQAVGLFARARQLDTFGLGPGCRALGLAADAAGDPVTRDRMLARARRCAVVRASPREAALDLLCEAQLAQQHGDVAAVHARATQAARAFEAMRMAWHAARARALAEAPPSSAGAGAAGAPGSGRPRVDAGA